MQVPVLWIDLDNGKRRTDERFAALGRARNLPPDIPLRYVSMPKPWLDASKEDLLEKVGEVIRHYDAKVVFMDNLGLMSGGVQENDAAMSGVMGNLRRLTEETGAAVTVIHHQRKGNGNGGRKGESLRGHSSIEAALDLALHVDREEGGDAVLVTPTKVRGPDFAPFRAEFTYTHSPGTKELAEAMFYGRQDDPAEIEALDHAILEAVGSKGPAGSLNKGQLVKAAQEAGANAGVNTIRRRIDKLAKDGKLVVSQGAGKGKGQGTALWYRLA